MSKFSLIISVIISAAISVHSEPGYCPDVKLVQNFKPEEYVGKWYEIQRYPMFFEEGNKCTIAEYSAGQNGTIGVHNMATMDTIDLPVHIKGKATPNDNPANLTVEFDNVPGKGKYWVLDTDYKTYSLVYGCQQAADEPQRIEFAWILSRTPTLNTKIIGKLTKKLEAVGSSVSNFETTIQKGCDYTLYENLDEGEGEGGEEHEGE